MFRNVLVFFRYVVIPNLSYSHPHMRTCITCCATLPINSQAERVVLGSVAYGFGCSCASCVRVFGCSRVCVFVCLFVLFVAYFVCWFASLASWLVHWLLVSWRLVS